MNITYPRVVERTDFKDSLYKTYKSEIWFKKQKNNQGSSCHLSLNNK